MREHGGVQLAEVAVVDLPGVLFAHLQLQAAHVDGQILRSGHPVFLQERRDALLQLGRCAVRIADAILDVRAHHHRIGQRMNQGRDVADRPRREETVGRPESEQRHQREPRRRRPCGHGERDEEEDAEVDQVGRGHDAETPRRGAGIGRHDRHPAQRERRDDDDRQRAEHAQHLSQHEIAGPEAQAQELAQRAALAFARKGVEREQHDNEREHHLQRECDGQFAEPLRGSGVGGRPKHHLILVVRFEPGANAGKRLDARVDETGREPRLENVEAVVRAAVRILVRLVVPTVQLLRLRGRLLREQCALVMRTGEHGHREQRQHDARRTAEAAVAEQLGEFLAGDVGDHRGGGSEE